MQFSPAPRIMVVTNEYQSNRIINRRLIVVKGRQEKLRDSQDTTRVVETMHQIT